MIIQLVSIGNINFYLPKIIVTLNPLCCFGKEIATFMDAESTWDGQKKLYVHLI